MGWLKKITKTVMSPIQKAIDPLLPESVKKLENKIDNALGGAVWGGTMASNIQDNGGAAGTAASTGTTAAQATGTITEEEAQAVAQKRLARLGKYFTSPLGVLGNASTAAQKVFS